MKLTKAQRDAFFDRSKPWPKLAGEGKPPVKAGYVHRLSSRVSFVVDRVHIRRGRWRLEYRVIDDREERFYLMPGSVSFATDEQGKLLPMPPEEEIGYTRNPRRTKLDRAPSVPPRIQHVLEMRSRLQGAEYDQAERAEELAKRDARTFTAMVKETVTEVARSGGDPQVVLRDLERTLAEHRSEQQAA